MVFAVAQRNTKELLFHIKAYLERISVGLSSDGAIERNISEWRSSIIKVEASVSEMEDSLRACVESYWEDGESLPADSLRWTSLDPAFQKPRKPRARLFYHGPATRDEIDDAKVSLADLTRSIQTILAQCRQTSALLQSTLAIVESKRGIAEAESVTKLTELAFLFIPISFSTTFFSMPVDVSKHRGQPRPLLIPVVVWFANPSVYMGHIFCGYSWFCVRDATGGSQLSLTSTTGMALPKHSCTPAHQHQ